MKNEKTENLTRAPAMEGKFGSNAFSSTTARAGCGVGGWFRGGPRCASGLVDAAAAQPMLFSNDLREKGEKKKRKTKAKIENIGTKRKGNFEKAVKSGNEVLLRGSRYLNFRGLVLGCIKTKFSDQILIGKHYQ